MVNKQPLFLVAFLFPLSLLAQNVGIGTETPEAKLDVIGPVKITDGTQGTGKVLTSGANGQATWVNPPAPSFFMFNTGTTIVNGQYLSPEPTYVFLQAAVVIPVDCVLSYIVFSDKGQLVQGYRTATVYRQTASQTAPSSTVLSVIIPPGLNFNTQINPIIVNRGDLISVRITYSGTGTSLPSGGSVALAYK